MSLTGDVGMGGGSVLGISPGTMRSGQFSSTNELPLIIPMDQRQQPNNVPILSSILTSSSSGASGSGHNNNNSNNYTSGNGGGGNPINGTTSTLKKRVQIQEVTV